MKELTRELPSAGGAAAAGPGARRPAGKRLYWIVGALAVLAAIAAAYLLRPKAGPHITTMPVARKTLVALVTATGTVNPQNTISVGTQVSGTIQSYAADFNDPVHEGQVLCRLDPVLFQAALDQARASLAQAQGQWQAALADAHGATSTAVAAYANASAAAENVRVAAAAVTSAEANVDKARAALALAVQTVARDKDLLAAGFMARSQYDTDYSNQAAADAGLKTAVVTERQAQMQLRAARSQATAGTATGNATAAQAAGFEKTAAADLAAIDVAQAQVRQASINLNHTVITSPVNGTVIARNIAVGQTVAASFQTPTLYTIAQDLTKMEIDLAVGEPDVGSVRAGERVDFTVLAYPHYTFHGTVAQVRKNPTTLQNVVTYDTVVYENNSDNRLLPGMTANAAIHVGQADDALVVPLAALSFTPSGRRAQPAGAAPQATPAASAWGDTGTAENATLAAGSSAHVYVVDAGNLRSVPVRIVLVSGGEAAIEPIGQGLSPGTRIAISQTSPESEAPGRMPGLLR